MKRGVIIVVAILVVFLVPMVFSYAPTMALDLLSRVPLPGEEKITLVFVGDIMTDRSVAKSVRENFGGDFNKLFDKLSFLKEADLAFGNLEGPVSDVGRNVGSIYSFRMSPASLEALATAGFDVLSVANNHAGDWSLEAFIDMLKRLKALGILYPGGGMSYQEAKAVQVKEIKGIKIGFLGFTDVGPNWLKADTGPGILLASDPDYVDIIKTAAAEVDVLVVSIHFGEEYKPLSNDRQKYLARTAIDSGAKLVIGHHPHVIEETERYKGGVIAYSLGNFIFDQYFSKETMEGGVLEVVLKGKEIDAVNLKKVILDYRFQPAPAWQ